MKIQLKLSALVVASILSGCASLGENEYGCKGMPEGSICDDPIVVYEHSHDVNDLEKIRTYPDDENEDTDEASNGTDSYFGDGDKKKKKEKQSEETVVMVKSKQLIVNPLSPKPVLEPASIMRIWMAPWNDNNDDLHWPGYIFTEVTPRRWSFGEASVGSLQPKLPVHVQEAGKVRKQYGNAYQDRSQNGVRGGMQ